jgi:hypothetical protein
MIITLNEQEIAHAIEKYIRGKNTSDHPNHVYNVKVLWRSEPPRAEITITQKDETPAGASIPTLTDQATDG